MKLFIKPTFDNIREDLGYDEFEDVDEDAIMFQQGYDGDIMEVEDGESFEIPNGYLASIIEDEPYYMLFEYFEGNWDKEEIYDDIDAGRYSLNGNTIKKITDSDIIKQSGTRPNLRLNNTVFKELLFYGVRAVA